jgi:hypothetical protein
MKQRWRAWRDAVGRARTAGERLIDAKGLVALGHRLPWLEANFPGQRADDAGIPSTETWCCCATWRLSRCCS